MGRNLANLPISGEEEAEAEEETAGAEEIAEASAAIRWGSFPKFVCGIKT